MRHRQKIAIARLISDLIKMDAVICHEEIAAYNQIIKAFDISDLEINEAQQCNLPSALEIVKQMSQEEQQRFFKLFYEAAYSDKICLAREALFLLTIANITNDKEEKYKLFSCDWKGYQMQEKYVIYLESDYMPIINDEIMQEYEAISNMLQLWNFEFIYIPKLSQSFRDMDKAYLHDILRYMNPRLTADMLDKLSERLTTFTTESYTRDYLTHTCNEAYFYDIQPSLLINVGASIFPSKMQSQYDNITVNLLTIQLNDEPNSVLNEVRRLIEQYESYITEPEFHRPQKVKNVFKYYGLYKQLFDFLARHKTNGEENNILIDIPAHRIWMRGEEIPLPVMQLATYMLILHQSYCSHVGGLRKVGQHFPLSEEEIKRLTKVFNLITNLFRGNLNANTHTYLEEVNNIRSYITRIRTAITTHIDSEDVSYYLPKDSIDKNMYHITLDPSHIRIRDAKGEYLFQEYPLWKQVSNG